MEGKRLAGYFGVTLVKTGTLIRDGGEGFCDGLRLSWVQTLCGSWLKDCMGHCGLVMLVVEDDEAASVLLFCPELRITCWVFWEKLAVVAIGRLWWLLGFGPVYWASNSLSA